MLLDESSSHEVLPHHKEREALDHANGRFRKRDGLARERLNVMTREIVAMVDGKKPISKISRDFCRRDEVTNAVLAWKLPDGLPICIVVVAMKKQIPRATLEKAQK